MSIEGEIINQRSSWNVNTKYFLTKITVAGPRIHIRCRSTEKGYFKKLKEMADNDWKG